MANHFCKYLGLLSWLLIVVGCQNTAPIDGDLATNVKNLIGSEKHDWIQVIGNVAYARDQDKRSLTIYPLIKEGERFRLGPAQETNWSLVFTIDSPGRLAAAAYVTQTVEKSRRQRPRDVVHLDENGEVIATYPKGDSVPHRYGKVWKQKLEGKKWIFVDDDGVAVSPPLKNLKKVGDLFVVELEGDLCLPVRQDGLLPMEGEGFLGYEHIGPPSRAPYYWLVHYEIEGQKQFGIATTNAEKSSGPMWSEYESWHMPYPNQVDQLFVFSYPQGKHFFGRSLEDGMWRLYRTQRHGERGGLKEMPEVVGGPARTKQETTSAEEARIKSQYRKMVQQERLRKRKKYLQAKAEAEKERKKAEAAAKYAAEQIRKMAERIKKELAKREEAKQKFEIALQKGDRKEASRLSQIAKGNTYGRYLLTLHHRVATSSWWRAYNWATDSEIARKCYEKYQTQVKADIAIAEANARARRNAPPRFDWGDFWGAVHAAQNQNLRNQAFGNSDRGEATREYTRSLRRWTYGQQDWHYRSP